MKQSPNVTTINIFTKRKAGGSHVPSQVVIDWSDMTLEMYRTLAEQAILHNIQSRIFDGKMNVEESAKVQVYARAAVHEPSVARMKLMPSRSEEELKELAEANKVRLDTITELLKNLPAEEIAALLRG